MTYITRGDRNDSKSVIHGFGEGRKCLNGETGPQLCLGLGPHSGPSECPQVRVILFPITLPDSGNDEAELCRPSHAKTGSLSVLA